MSPWGSIPLIVILLKFAEAESLSCSSFMVSSTDLGASEASAAMKATKPQPELWAPILQQEGVYLRFSFCTAWVCEEHDALASTGDQAQTVAL